MNRSRKRGAEGERQIACQIDARDFERVLKMIQAAASKNIANKYTPIAINSIVETEDVLGPLPENWERCPWGKTRYLYVDHGMMYLTFRNKDDNLGRPTNVSFTKTRHSRNSGGRAAVCMGRIME